MSGFLACVPSPEPVVDYSIVAPRPRTLFPSFV